MTETVKKLLNIVTGKQHHKFREDISFNPAEEYSAKGLSPVERMSERFSYLMKAQKPVILPEEKICIMRTTKGIPDCFTEKEWIEIKEKHYIHESGYWSNLSPDYESIISRGLLDVYDECDEYGKKAIDSVFDLADRYRDEAVRCGRNDVAKVFERIPRCGAESFREALQFFRIVHFALWLEGNYHITVGRFDVYMYPYLKSDLEKGVLTEDEAFELLEDFFISFSKDSDLYPGVQQGDNGQSMVLGGIDSDGNEVFNLLSKMCLKASNELLLIDPKINLRVNKNTPVEIYELGSELTKAGLGFPQYSNDDVVIEGLEKLGYETKDARDYVAAACWEFIIPKIGCDVANIGALSLTRITDICLHNHLVSSETFEEFMDKFSREVKRGCDEIADEIRNLWFVPSPFMNVVMACNIYEGGKYNNFGFHGTGIATAADSLAAIKKYVFDEKKIDKERLIKAVDSDFEGESELLHLLRYEAPKFGNGDDEADTIAVAILDSFSKALEGKINCKGGKFRAGTGSAMFYLWHADEVGATPDGRRKGEPLGTNFSPSLFAKINGPFSIIKSFSKPHFENAINGGPLTLEFHQSVFSDDDGIEKIGILVKTFIDRGGHQLQLNTVNIATLLDAQKHPEKYKQLVVRIWGWSAYFVELDKEYQDHVIKRQVYAI